MRAPDFWKTRGMLSSALLPLAGLYACAAHRRATRAATYKAAVPVICIGNLVAGGAGKTPVALALSALLSARTKRRLFFLTRGYGGAEKGPLRVDAARHDARDVGDEALLLASQDPTVMSRDRAAGAVFAQEQGAELLLLDDGFQNPALHKDFCLLVIDGGYGFGNGRVLPAGPLREPVAEGAARAQAAVIVGEDVHGAAAQLAGLPLFHARLAPRGNASGWAGRRVVAFAGIGRPGKFYATLRELGCEPLHTLDFPDHHRYTQADERRLLQISQASGAELVTTAKDAVRLSPAMRARANVLEVEIRFDDAEGLLALLAPYLA